MSQWINRFLENESVNRTDKTDKPIDGGPLSVMSVRPLGLLGKNSEKIANNPETGTDKTDKPIDEGLLSVMSVRDHELLDQNFCPYSEQDFEERLAITECDGGLSELHTHRIAYLDAFISVLAALPAMEEQRDWLNQRIQTSLAWIETQNFLTCQT